MAIAAESGGKAAPAVDGRAALAKLTGGQTLTPAERQYLGLSPAPESTITKQAPVTPVAKTISRTESNGDGTYTEFYSDGTSAIMGNKIVPGSTGLSGGSERTLAKDTFANTLALLTGIKEASEPWVNEMYGIVSGFYNSGSDINDAINLGLYEAKSKGVAPKFTERFAPIFKLQERLQKGEAVTVPTVAEYVKSEAELGDIMREAGLGDLATQKFLGDILVDKSVLTATNIITSVFDRIDNAPSALKEDLTSLMGLGASRTDIAKALLTGTEGAAALEKKINQLSVVSAAKTQGISVDLGTAADLAAGGATYGTAMTGFGQVKDLQRADVLARFSGGSFTQDEAVKAAFQKNKAALDKAEEESRKESARFMGQAGLSASALRGRNTRQQI